MRKAIAASTAFVIILASAAAALAASAPGIGSSVSGRDSAGGQFSFAFDALTHGSQYDPGEPITGAYMYSLGDTFSCSGKKSTKKSSKKPAYSFNTLNNPQPFRDGTMQPFPAVNDSYQSFHFVFSTHFQNGSGLKNEPGKAVVSISGRIKQTSGPVGGPGKAIANGTIGVRVSGACHTGTLTWSAKGPIVNPS
jgi:hypothetical protein